MNSLTTYFSAHPILCICLLALGSVLFSGVVTEVERRWERDK